MKTSLATILKLMAKKYPGNKILCIYDDESGRIVDMNKYDGDVHLYDVNPLFWFSSIQELVEHLQS